MPLTLDPGTVVDGKYRIERVLGQGGMGVVVAASHVELGTEVALKLLRPELAANESLLARFRREARAVAALSSDNTVRVFDVSPPGASPTYIVMERLRGRDLGTRLAQGSFEVPEAVDYVLQACAALAEAHAVGVIHRDLKPTNLFLARAADGSTIVKVLDFGISKVTGRLAAGAAQTSRESIMGTPTYMSPEQLDAKPDVDGRTDIWTLGVILFELLTGQQPFEAPTLPQLCMKIIREPAPPAQSFRVEVPPELDVIIARCLEKDPRRRFATALDLAEALARFAPPATAAAVPRMHAVQREALSRQRGSEAPPPPRDALARIERESIPPVAEPALGRARPRDRGAPLVGVAIGVIGLAALFVAQLEWPSSRRAVVESAASAAARKEVRAAAPSPSVTTPAAVSVAGASAMLPDDSASATPRGAPAAATPPPASAASARQHAPPRRGPSSDDDALFGGRK